MKKPKITLYMATTIDGFIAKEDGDSDWVSPADTENFEKAIKENGCIILGRTTFEQYKGELYLVDGVTNIVITSDNKMNSKIDNVFFVNAEPENIIKIIIDQGHDKALLIGGGKTNSLFLRKGLIDEVIICLHPLVFAKGIKLFEDGEYFQKLELISNSIINGELIQLKYKVLK